MKRLSIIILALLSSACVLGPDYQRPASAAPDSFKEASASNGWKIAQPNDELLRDAWWELYGDTTLNDLAQQALLANQNLALAEARYRQAEAVSRSYQAQQYPSLTGNFSSNRSKRSGTAVGVGSGRIVDIQTLSLAASWEADVWGRIRRQVEAGQASLKATKADVEVARLSLLTTLAQSYFQLRTLDTQIALLEKTLQAFERSYQMTLNRYQAGVSTKADVSQSLAQVKTTQVQAADLKLQRVQTEHLIATLVGKAPAELSLSANAYAVDLGVALPAIPASVPSALLERRPDIAAAERRVAAANANIGLAKVAFFPALTLGASAGYQSANISDLITTPSRIWAIGPAIALSIFDGGLRRAQTDAAIANHEATVATYRQTVLSSFQETEDYLVALDSLAEESSLQEAAVRAADDSLQQSNNRYKAGTLDYLSVVTWQTNLLNSQRNAIAIQGRRLQASVGLIKAIGGGWHEHKLDTQYSSNQVSGVKP